MKHLQYTLRKPADRTVHNHKTVSRGRSNNRFMLYLVFITSFGAGLICGETFVHNVTYRKILGGATFFELKDEATDSDIVNVTNSANLGVKFRGQVYI